MRDSIIQSKAFQDRDLFDSRVENIHRHHVFFGERNREKADEDGEWVSLSEQHHENGENPRAVPGRICSVHSCPYMRKLLCMVGQLAWEKNWYKSRLGFMDDQDPAREEFLKRYGEKYL